MSYSTNTLQKAAEMVMFGALCFAAADIVWARLESRAPEPTPVSLTSAAAAAAPPAPPAPPALQGVLTGQPRIAPPVPPPPPGVAAPLPAAARPAATPPQQPLPVLAGTLVGKGVYLAVMQANGGTTIVRTGDRIGPYIVNWVGPYKACVKDSQGKKHVLALGVGTSASSRPAVPYVAPTPVTHSSVATSGMHHVAYNSAPPPPPPPPPPAGRGFGVTPPR